MIEGEGMGEVEAEVEVDLVRLDDGTRFDIVDLSFILLAHIGDVLALSMMKQRKEEGGVEEWAMFECLKGGVECL